jgi:hypothetical protein
MGKNRLKSWALALLDQYEIVNYKSNDFLSVQNSGLMTCYLLRVVA